MNKNLKPKTIRKEASAVLDGSYVELQEQDFLDSQAQEFSFAISEEEEKWRY